MREPESVVRGGRDNEDSVLLAEREPHTQHFQSLVRDACRGKGRVVLLDGALATGKTELLRVVAERAADHGMTCLEAICAPAEAALPLGVVRQLAQSPALPRETRHRAAGCLDRMSLRTDDAELTAVITTVCAAVLDLATDGPLLITVDDGCHADPASVRCLLHLARRIRSVPVLLVVVGGLGPPTGGTAIPTELRRQPGFTQIRVAPLSADGVTAVLADEFGDAEARRLTPELTATSGGNPRLLRALIDDRRQAPERYGAGYGAALLSCLHHAGAGVLRVARAIAVLGRCGSPDTIGRLLGTDPKEVARALDTMDAAGLLDEGAYRLPAGPAAVLEELTDDERAALHHGAAEVLADLDAPVATIAGHLVAAGRAEAGWGVTALVAAAEEALVDDDLEPAAAALALAHTSSPDGPGRITIRARLAQTEWQIDPAAAARHLTPLAVAATAGLLDHRHGVMLVRQLLWHGRLAEAQQVLDRIRGTIGAVGAAHAAAELTAADAWLLSTYPTLAGTMSEASPVPLPSNGRSVPELDPTLRSAAEMAAILTRGVTPDAVGAAQTALRGVHVRYGISWADEAALLALLVLLSANRADTAASWCDRLLGESFARRSPRWRALFTAVRATIASRQGDLPETMRLARTALDQLAPKSWGLAIGLPLGNLLLAATRSGRYQDAARLLTRPVPDGIEASRYGLPYLFARGTHHLATTHHEAALADFTACGRLVRRCGLDRAGLVPWRAGAAEAWLRLGRPDQARRVLYDEFVAPGADESVSRTAAMRLLATLQPLRRRPYLLGQTLTALETVGDRYEQARTLLELGRAQHALGGTRQARMSYRRAWQTASACGATPLCDELLAVQDDLTGPALGDTPSASAAPTGIAALTDSERRVAALAALGHTNREIATRLRVTASTVEQHLTRVYRKLGVKRRDDLPVELHVSTSTSTSTSA